MRRSPFDKEFHEAEARDPRMVLRLQTRNVILVSAALLVPISVLLLVVVMIAWKFNPDLPQDIWASAILHPFLSGAVALGGVGIHRMGEYRLAAMMAASPVINLIYFVFAFGGWAAA